MSKHDRLVIADTALLPEILRRDANGVSFASFVLVEAARLDDIEDGRVLEWLDIPRSAFERAEEAFGECLMEALGSDHPDFEELYDELITRALSQWSRRLPPLDEHVEAWVTFQRHALVSEEPASFASAHGLTAGDELRLAALWRARMSDPAVVERATAAMAAPLPEKPVPLPAPLVFPPR